MALFPANHTLTQGSLHYRLATLGYQKHNTYGVEMCISYHDSRFLRLYSWQINPKKRNTYGVVPRKPYVNPG